MQESEETLLRTGRFDVVRRTHALPGGGSLVRETILHPGAVVILPLLTDGRVCLIRNYRLAIGQALWELPAGTLEPGEAPLEAARRELAEETGYRAAEWRHLLDFWMSPGILRERMHLFLAAGLSAGDVQLAHGEEIETLPHSWAECLAMCQSGAIEDAKTLVALLHYERFGRSS